MGENRNAYRLLVGKPEGKSPLGRPRRRWVDNIRMDLGEIRSVMTYAFPAWEFAAECHLLKLQRLQNKVPRTIGKFPKRTSVRDMHKSFHMPYVYDYITKSCRQKAEVIQNHEN
jgi:hypothetical protein